MVTTNPPKKKSTARRDALLKIQNAAQEKWAKLRIFEEDAPPPHPDKPDQEKFLVTFPYPYCNGFLHIGHAFSLSKGEFAVGYKRMKGIKCLFPFGFHCTGMPIQASATKLEKELATFGCPPVFPVREQDVEINVEEGHCAVDKSKARKGKLANKKGPSKYVWEILKESGIDEEIIPRFANPLEWLKFFPMENVNDLTSFGLKTDWRRTFITTEENPYYDSFVKWQFNKLRQLKKIKFGKRNAVFSPIDGQPCADHDRSSGEGVQPQEYTLIKLRLLSLPNIPFATKLLAGRDVFLPAATLRPETMYGQTNVWVLPTGEYTAYELANNDIYICSKHSARNMAHQDFFSEFGKTKELGAIMGTDLIGLPVKAPLAKYDEIYVLPLMTVSMEKGTGVVTSVPSDAPDDFRGLMDLKEKDALRAKFDLKEEWVMPFEPIPIIDTPGFGNQAAVEACKRHKIRSQNDKDALTKAKEEVYKAGYYNGIMIVGDMTGEPVSQAKPRIRNILIASGEGRSYSEPEKKVMSRSGDECVVALCDQWYLEYGEDGWRERTERCLEKMELYHDETRNAFEFVLGWLKEWACSRQFGLGTKLPWDGDWLIESLSDSTIYMAFYTVAHLLQGGTDNLSGKTAGPSGIPSSAMSDTVWDYIMLGHGKPEALGVDVTALQQMRSEFTYWYPVNLRVSGKDLVGNHLAFFLYNHVAIFPEEYWPQGIRVNGHVLVDAEKMSKSKGNFLTLRSSIAQYTADGVRFALADASDTVEDANFAKATAGETVLKLWTLVDFIEEAIENVDSMITGPLERFADRVFVSQLNKRLRAAEAAYEQFTFREAVKEGFFGINIDLGKYREAVGADKSTREATLRRMHRDVFLKFALYQTAALAPICPHTCEHMWELVEPILTKRDGFSMGASVMNVRWPSSGAPNEKLLAANDYLNDIVSRIRLAILKPAKKKKKQDSEPSTKPTNVAIYICKETPKWQKVVLDFLRDDFDESAWIASRETNPKDEELWWKFPPDTPKRVATSLSPEQKSNKKLMPFLATVRKEVEMGGASALDRSLKFDEMEVITRNMELVKRQLAPFGIADIIVGDTRNVEGSSGDAVPGTPMFVLS